MAASTLEKEGRGQEEGLNAVTLPCPPCHRRREGGKEEGNQGVSLGAAGVLMVRDKGLTMGE